MAAGADLPPAVRAGDAGEAAPEVADAGPANEGIRLPPPSEEAPPTLASADSPCWDLCYLDPVGALVMLTVYVMLCAALTVGVLKLLVLLRAATRRGIDMLEDAYIAGRR